MRKTFYHSTTIFLKLNFTLYGHNSDNNQKNTTSKMKTLFLFVSVAVFLLHSLLADANSSNTVKGELEEDAEFWTRTLATSMSMSMNLGDESYASGGSCGFYCTRDKDCQPGGYNPCPLCGQYVGAQYYQRCYDPNQYTPSPTPYNYFPDGGMCGKSCKKDNDCRKGGYNPCAWCGKYVGTIMYELCYSDPDYQ